MYGYNLHQISFVKETALVLYRCVQIESDEHDERHKITYKVNGKSPSSWCYLLMLTVADTELCDTT